jgi:hypothetical protein
MQYVAPIILALFQADTSSQPAWAGDGHVRIIVRVHPTNQGPVRAGDERPAEVVLEFPRLLAEMGADRLPDLNTLQVIRYDPATGKPIAQTKFAYGRGNFEIPWRWYDAGIDYDFPEFEGNIDATDGKLNFVRYPRFGYFYDCIGDGKQGHLAFIHREDGKGSAWYAVTFDLLPPGAKPETVEPRGWVGDGLQRCEPVGESTTGLIHSRVDVTDWDGDGLFDMIVGCARGGAVWYPNCGKPTEPRFPSSRLMKTIDGMPLDIGWSASPHAVDWDGDGLTDLLVGGEMNRLVWFRNVGNKAKPALKYEGFVCTEDGKPLSLPWEPSPETEKYFKYTRDYYPVVTAVDWDGDGDLDLLAGGYVTGRIYLFENAAGKGKLPSLRFVGPLEADGKPIDVGWCAAPTAGDLDGDGDLDLITGSMPMAAGGGDSASSEKFLYYFRNDGTRARPKLHQVPFPKKGEFPAIALSTPRLIDWSGDGLLDLVVSACRNIYLFRNIGTAHEPRFEAHTTPLPSRWGSAALPGRQFVDPDRQASLVSMDRPSTSRGIAPGIQIFDWDGDGLPDVIDAPYVYRNTGRGSPGVYERPISLLAKGQVISHLSGIGDDWRFQELHDLDGDGRIDLMDADHAGHFWWHRNRGTNTKPDFDTKGVMLMLKDGKPVSVGEGMEGFDALQGARATYAVADFDGDGLPDLVTANALGVLQYFRQSPRSDPKAAPYFEPGIQIGKLPTRAVPYAADWNGDGRLDVVVASDSDNAFVFLGQRGTSGSPFSNAQRVHLPKAPYGAGAPVTVVDFNGDGDPDILLLTPYGYCCFYEHSFITSGYARGEVVTVNAR